MKKSFATLLMWLLLTLPCLSGEFTLGTIQQNIHSGMSQTEVVSCLGAPNMVTKDACGCETWIYNKISQSTTEVYNRKWYFLFLFGRRKGCKNTETSQKTITVTLNFNKDSCLECFTYNASSF